jgi:hypothetical protein
VLLVFKGFGSASTSLELYEYAAVESKASLDAVTGLFLGADSSVLLYAYPPADDEASEPSSWLDKRLLFNNAFVLGTVFAIWNSNQLARRN